MKVKKLICALAVFVMTVSLCACGGEGASGSGVSKSLYEQGMGVISLMAEAAQTEEYVASYTGNPEIMEIIQSIGSGDYAAPKAVYSLTVSHENLLASLGLGSLDGISVELKNNLLKKQLVH